MNVQAMMCPRFQKGGSMSGHSGQMITKTIKAHANRKHGSIFTEISREIPIPVKPGSVLNRDTTIRSTATKARSVSMSADTVLTDKSMLTMLADICKTLSNPKRIEILSILQDDEKTVAAMVTALGASKANVSQHLAVMRHRGILDTRRNGVNIYYRVTNQKIIEASTLMKSVLLGQYTK
jgi:DNA-binding transcriptional ArsR family regulator